MTKTKNTKKTTDDAVACCRQHDSDLNATLKAWAVESNMKEQEVSRRVLDALDKVGPGSTLVLSVSHHGQEPFWHLKCLSKPYTTILVSLQVR